MIRIQLIGDDHSDVVRQAQELKEALGDRTDFGIPRRLQPGTWLLTGHILTPAEFDRAQESGIWPTLDGKPDPRDHDLRISKENGVRPRRSSSRLLIGRGTMVTILTRRSSGILTCTCAHHNVSH